MEARVQLQDSALDPYAVATQPHGNPAEQPEEEASRGDPHLHQEHRPGVLPALPLHRFPEGSELEVDL